MNANTRMTVIATISVLFAAGCISEQERRERAAQEKVRQEQAAKDEHERRERLAREAKERSERQAKEREERAKRERAERLAKARAAIDSYWSGMAENNSKIILSYRSPKTRGWNYMVDDDVQLQQMLKNWVLPRLNLTEEERGRGVALLEEFGTKYLPNAYDSYEKVRERAQEMQQLFNENFPKSLPPDKQDSAYAPYCKMLKGLSKIRSEYFRKHDELCHFYLMHKAGAISAAELVKIDGSPISVWLLEEMPFGRMPIESFGRMPKNTYDKIMEFTNKHAPETHSVMQRISEERKTAVSLYKEMVEESRLIDATRFELSVVACCEKANYIAKMIRKLLFTDLKALQIEYATMEKDASAIAKWDHENALKLTRFAELLTSYVADRANGPLIAANSKMNEFFPCDDVLQWHLYASGCLCSGSWHNGATRDEIPRRFGIYQYCYRRNIKYTICSEGKDILKEEMPVWQMAFAKFNTTTFHAGCEGRGVRFCAMIDSPSLYHLFPYPEDKDTNTYHSDTYEVRHEEIETDYDRKYRSDAYRHGIEVSGLENLLINKSHSPFLKRLQELDGDKGRYSLAVKKNNYGQFEIVKVAISSERNLCR